MTTRCECYFDDLGNLCRQLCTLHDGDGGVPKREAELKAEFARELQRLCPGFVTLELATAGAPDRIYNAGGRTTYLEFKHGTPAFDSPGNQELCCMRLEATAHCRYVIWQERRGVRRTLVARPVMVHRRRDWDIVAEETFAGFNHLSVVSWLRRWHGV